MTNADLFKIIFGLYATEIWAKPEQDFLKWLNSPVPSTISKSEIVDCISRKRAIDEGERWLFNLEDKRTIGEMLRDVPSVQPEIKTDRDTISRQQAIDALYNIDEYNSRSVIAIKNLPPAQSNIICCKDCKYLCNEDGLRGMCWHINGFGTDVKDKYNSFCSWAERRQECD